jgi:drug/metabolite transporter (DMT)-like permease
MPRRSSSAAGEELRGSVSLLATIVTWGVTYALTKVALHHLPPSEVAFVRQAAAMPPFLWLVWRQREFLLPVRYVLPLAATGTIGFFLFANLGLARASASVGALVQGIAPVLIAVLAVGFLGERLTARIVAGIALALVGAGVLAWGAIHVTSALGLVFLFLSAASWSTYTVIGRSLGHRFTALQASFLPVALSVVVFAFGPLFEDWRPGGAGPLALTVALGFFGSGLAYVTFSYGIARVPAARAGIYSNLVPVIALLVAWLALGESIGTRQAVGGAVVVLGALLASWRGPFSRAAPSITVERCEASGSRRP